MRCRFFLFSLLVLTLAGKAQSNGWRGSTIEWTWHLMLIRSHPDTSYLKSHFISNSNQTHKDGRMIDRSIFGNIYRTSLEEDEEEVLEELRPDPMGAAHLRFDHEKGKGTSFTLFDAKGWQVRQKEGIEGGASNWSGKVWKAVSTSSGSGMGKGVARGNRCCSEQRETQDSLTHNVLKSSLNGALCSSSTSKDPRVSQAFWK